jgi:hypothetical protein
MRMPWALMPGSPRRPGCSARLRIRRRRAAGWRARVMAARCTLPRGHRARSLHRAPSSRPPSASQTLAAWRHRPSSGLPAWPPAGPGRRARGTRPGWRAVRQNSRNRWAPRAVTSLRHRSQPRRAAQPSRVGCRCAWRLAGGQQVGQHLTGHEVAVLEQLRLHALQRDLAFGQHFRDLNQAGACAGPRRRGVTHQRRDARPFDAGWV